MGPENVANPSLLAKKRLIRCPVCPRCGSGSPAGPGYHLRAWRMARAVV